MKFYSEEKLLKARNILIVVLLLLLSILLAIKVYSYFEGTLNIIVSTIFPFILSFVIVYSLIPFIDMLEEIFKLKRIVAISLVLFLYAVFTIYVILAFIPLIASQLSSLIEFFIKNQGIVQKNIFTFLEANNINIRDSLISSKDAIFSATLKVLNSSVSILTGTFSFLFMTPIFTIMLIFSYDKFKKGVRKFFIKIGKKEIVPLLRDMDDAIGKYIKVTVVDSIIVGIVSYIIFFFLKLEYSSLFSIIIGVGNIIPFIGPFIGLIPVILYAFTKSFRLVVAIVVAITILQTIEANIIKPYLTSKSVNIHPITTLLVVLIGGALAGIGGAFIAVPIYIVLKLGFEFYFNRMIENEKNEEILEEDKKNMS